VKRRAGSGLLGLLALAFGLGVTHATLASPASSYGFGARQRSLAGAGVSLTDDASAVFENPAGLVRASDTEISFGYHLTDSGLTLNGRAAALPPIHTFELGLDVPGSLAGMPVAFGFALSLPDGRLSRLREVSSATPYFPLDDMGPRLVDLGAAVAIRPLDQLVIGAGVGYVASLRGSFGVSGTAVAVDRSGNQYDSALTHAVHAELGSARFPLLGIGYLPSERLAFGAAFRGAARVEQRLAGTLETTLVSGPLELPIRYDFRSTATVAYLPAQWELGASYRVLPSLWVALELGYQAWGGYPSPFARTESRTELDLPPEAELELPPDAPPVPVPPARLVGRFVPRIAVEPTFPLAHNLTLRGRAGYAYQRSPVPRVQRSTMFLDVDRHLFAGGAGLELAGPVAPFSALRLDLSLSLEHGVARNVRSEQPGGEVRLRAAGDVLSLGATLGLVFGSGPR
jgi:long-chain fatty acid transport protein